MTKVLYERTTAQPQSLAAHSRDMAAILQALGDPARAAPPPDVERTVKLPAARKRIALLRALMTVSGLPELLPKRTR